MRTRHPRPETHRKGPRRKGRSRLSGDRRGRRLILFLGLAIIIMILVDNLFPHWFPSDAIKDKAVRNVPIDTAPQTLPAQDGAENGAGEQKGHLNDVLRRYDTPPLTDSARDVPSSGPGQMADGSAIKPLILDPIFNPVLPEEKFKPFQEWIADQQAYITEEVVEMAKREIARAKAMKEKRDQELARLNALRQGVPKTSGERDTPPAWTLHAADFKPQDSAPKIVIIIDDLGQRRGLTRRFIALPGPMTMAFLPYADNLPDLIKQARAQNHESMLHIPMEPIKQSIDPGPNTLRSGMPPETLAQTLRHNLGTIEGVVGINNHMGSKITQDKRAMRVVMDILAEKGLLYVDSMTINSSVAAQTALEGGVPAQRRDIFLDHVAETDFIEGALLDLEEKARKNGYAVAIGHPYPETYAALLKWLPTLRDKGLQLAPITAVIEMPKADIKSHAVDAVSSDSKPAEVISGITAIPISANASLRARPAKPDKTEKSGQGIARPLPPP